MAGDRIVVSFDPGLVRIGRLVTREGPLLEVEFPRRQQQTLAVGSRVPAGLVDERRSRAAELVIPDRAAIVTERWEAGDARRYRLLMVDGDSTVAEPSVPRTTTTDRPLARTGALRVDLRFGHLDFRAEVIAWPVQSLHLRVAVETETLLRATDAIELVHRRQPGDAEIRLVGWIDRRVLDRHDVRYEFRIDDQLGEDGVRQRARLRSLFHGEARTDASQA